MPEDRCPLHEELSAFVAGVLAEAHIDRIAEHIDVCAACRRSVEAIEVADDRMIARVRSAATHKAPSLPSTFQNALRVVTSSKEGPTRAICQHCQNVIEISSSASPQEFTCPACGSSFTLDAGSTVANHEPERKIGRFVLMEVVGSGAFGTVYRASDPGLDRIVAIKLPRAGNLATAAERDRFLREARSVAQLRHPAVVPVYEVGTENGIPYIVSEFVHGTTLADLVRHHRLSFCQAAELVAAVAEVLGYAHKEGVVHRDVKPTNIMIAATGLTTNMPAGEPLGSPRLMDFGLAKRSSNEITMTLDGQILGTPAYMSPEQAAGQSHRVDGRSDLYSVGVILYQLLTGERPFRGNQQMVLDQVLNDEPRPPRRFNQHIPRDLELVCLKAMAKEPAHRYATGGDFAADLRRFLRNEPVGARPANLLYRLWCWLRRPERIREVGAMTLLTAALQTTWHILALADIGLGIGLGLPRMENSFRTMLRLLGVIALFNLPLFWIGVGTLKRRLTAILFGLLMALFDLVVTIGHLCGYNGLLGELPERLTVTRSIFTIFPLLAAIMLFAYGIVTVSYFSNKSTIRWSRMRITDLPADEHA